MQRGLPVGRVDGHAAGVRVAVQRPAGRDERARVGDRVGHAVALAAAGDVQRLVEVARARRVDGDERQVDPVALTGAPRRTTPPRARPAGTRRARPPRAGARSGRRGRLRGEDPTADGMPGGLELGQRLEAPQRIGIGRGTRTRLTVSAASSSTTAADSPQASTIAFTSRCPHRGFSSSSMRPVSRFSTPPGRPNARDLAEVQRAQRPAAGHHGDDVLPAARAGASSRRARGDLARPASTRPRRRSARRREAQERRRDRVDPAHHRRQLVLQPA